MHTILVKKSTTDFEDYYVGESASCRATEAPTFLTEVCTGVILDYGIKPIVPAPGETLQDRIALKTCIAPWLKQATE